MNFSFENTNSIPCSLGQYDSCEDVWNPNSTSVDLFSILSYLPCSNNVPENTFGFQDKNDGNNYIGLGLFTFDYTNEHFILPYHDFHGGTLSSSLQKNKVYQMTFFINRAENCEISSNALDVAFTYDTIIDIENLNNYGYKIWSLTNVFNDTINWVEINFCFKAKGGEKAFVVGNFHDTNQIQMKFPLVLDQGKACNYIYLDNFSLIECPTCCPDQFPPEQHVYVFSSPSAQNSPTSLQVWLSPHTTGELKIYDSAGRLVAQKSYAELENNFVFDNFAAGIYHFALSTSDGVLENGKVMVNQK